MTSADEDVPHITISLPQLRQLVELAESVTGEGEDQSTSAAIYEVGGLRAINRGIIAKINGWHSGGMSSEHTEALIDRGGTIRIGYEPDAK